MHFWSIFGQGSAAGAVPLEHAYSAELWPKSHHAATPMRGCGEFKWLRPCRRPLEFNSNFGSNLGLFGSGRGFNGRGAPVGFIGTDFQLKRSHDDPFRDQNRVFV